MKEKLLVIDDDPGFCTMLTRVLNDEGYNAKSACGGEEGLAEIEKEFYDLIILDIKMPKVDGIEVLRRLRQIQEGSTESSVIIITGYLSETTPIEALKLGAIDYVMKPFEIAEFLRSVERNINICRLRRERNTYVKELASRNKQLNNTINELKAARDKLLASERLAAIGQVASSVGHELRNPLGSIENVSYLIKKLVKSKDPKIRKYFNMLFKELDEANRIVNELLDFSHEKRLNKSKVTLNSVISEVRANIKLDDKIKLIDDISPKIGKVDIDPLRIKQVLTNLITNASHAIQKEGKITIKAKSENGSVKITVSDTGYGMTKEVINSIYNPFFTTKSKGIGLGLAIVREIVEKHDGKIEVESELKKGTTFTILLPHID